MPLITSFGSDGSVLDLDFGAAGKEGVSWEYKAPGRMEGVKYDQVVHWEVGWW